MRTGLFCTYENPSGDYRTAYAQQGEFIELAEQLGFDEAWVAEHHFNARTTSPSPVVTLAHIAARTSRIRLGTAAVLLPFHNPILVAEDAATLDVLSGGRLDLGVAKGGPFPLQNKHFNLNPEEARARAAEALVLIERLLSEEQVSFDGTFYKVDGVELVPRPLQRPVPMFLATSTPDMVKVAAEHRAGLMAGPPYPIAHVKDCLRVYREIAGNADPKLVLARFFHLAPTREQAVAEARTMLEPFVERMQVATAKLQPTWTAWMVMEPIIEGSLIGTEAEVRAKLEALEAELQPYSVILKPLSTEHKKQCDDLRVFAEMIRPALAA